MSGSSSKLLGFSRLSSCCALPRRGAASQWMSRWISSSGSNSDFLLGCFSGKSYNNNKLLWVGLQSLPSISSPFLILSPPRSPSRRTTSSSFLRTIAASSTSNGSSTTSSTTGTSGDGYELPVQEIMEIVDAPPTPVLSFSPKRDEILFLQRRSLPPLAEFARPELKLAGLRIDPAYNGRSRM
jgi:hypothetical protein